MEVKELISAIVKNGEWYGKKFDVEIDKDFAAYNLVKEIGQFAEATLIDQKRVMDSKKLDPVAVKDLMTQELVDIVALAIINADLHGIDLEKGLMDKWINKTGSWLGKD